MKITLHFPLPYAVVYGGKTYKLKPYFDNVLKVFALQKEQDLSERDRLEVSLDLLVKSKHSKLSERDKTGLLNAIYDVLMDEEKREPDGTAPIFDFVQDAGYIYASFLSDYGLDLYEQQGRLHWWAFIQLFRGLSEGAKIVQVMQIRAKPIPAPTKYNAEERKQLARLKAQYALKTTQEERERNFAAGLKRLAGLMRGIAENEEGSRQWQTER